MSENTNHTSAAAAIGVDPSGGVVHESGIDPEIDRERCEQG